MRRMDWTGLIQRGFLSVLLASLLCMNSLSALAAPPQAPFQLPPAGQPSGKGTETSAYVDKIRFSSDDEAFRLVFDMTAIPAYTVSINDMPLQVEIDLPQTVNRSGTGQFSFNDAFVEKLQFTDLGGGRLKAVMPLKLPVMTRVSILSSPPRLVIDLLKTYETRTEQIISPGVIYREVNLGRQGGPVKAYILEVDLKAGNTLRPVLSNDSVVGLETLSDMAERAQGIAMVNGPYFMRSGEIIGLLKIDKTIVSTPDVERTSFGVMPDGRLVFDTVTFSGYVEMPDGTKIPIDGINRSRGESELILYNPYYAYWTLTYGNGVEYTVRGDRVLDVHESNSFIPEGAVVLSASGRVAWQMGGLKQGARLKIVHTLGPLWDQAVQAVGAGPRLVKDGQIFVSTITEDFGSDVSGGRAPRTAIGVNKDGKALLAIVDGRSRRSIGFSLLELAQFMLDLGAVDAMNLDGGGSTEMIIGSQIVNQPSDGRERRIGAGIAVVRLRPVK